MGDLPCLMLTKLLAEIINQSILAAVNIISKI